MLEWKKEIAINICVHFHAHSQKEDFATNSISSLRFFMNVKEKENV
jgi:hypothetical protein